MKAPTNGAASYRRRQAKFVWIVALLMVTSGCNAATGAGSATNGACSSKGGKVQYLGGPVELSSTVHLIFWDPKKLQDGTANYSASNAEFHGIPTNLFQDLARTGIPLLSHYCMNDKNGRAQYITGKVIYGGYQDITDDYPTRGLNLMAPEDSVSGQDVQDRISKTIGEQANSGWKTGLDQIYMVFLDAGETFCPPSDRSWCFTSSGCEVHASYRLNGSDDRADVVYGVVPGDSPCVDPNLTSLQTP